MNYIRIEAHPDGGFVALAEKDRVDQIFRKESVLIHRSGEEQEDLVELRNENTSFILRLDNDGHLLWSLDVPYYRGLIMGLTVSSDGGIYIIGALGGWRQDVLGYYDSEEDGENTSDFGLIKLSPRGEMEKLVPITSLIPDSDMEITNFTAYHNQGFLIAGNIDEGKLTANLEAKARKGGGNFILMIDNEGIPIWGDVVSGRDGKCCAYAPEGRCIGVAPMGPFISEERTVPEGFSLTDIKP